MIVKVLEQQGVTAEQLAEGRDSLENELIESQRNRFYAAYMTKVRERLRDRININAETLTMLLG